MRLWIMWKQISLVDGTVTNGKVNLIGWSQSYLAPRWKVCASALPVIPPSDHVGQETDISEPFTQNSMFSPCLSRFGEKYTYTHTSINDDINDHRQKNTLNKNLSVPWLNSGPPTWGKYTYTHTSVHGNIQVMGISHARNGIRNKEENSSKIKKLTWAGLETNLVQGCTVRDDTIHLP